jgi:hypothetical protein
MVGFIAISIFWRDLVTNLLPPGSDGILIVIENICNPTFSFQVNGPDVEYLGRGDFHDPKYDSMGIGVSSQPYSEFRYMRQKFLTCENVETVMVAGAGLFRTGTRVLYWSTACE